MPSEGPSKPYNWRPKSLAKLKYYIHNKYHYWFLQISQVSPETKRKPHYSFKAQEIDYQYHLIKNHYIMITCLAFCRVFTYF